MSVLQNDDCRYVLYIHPMQSRPIRGQVSTAEDAVGETIVIAAPNDIIWCPYFSNAVKSFSPGSNH